MKLTRGEYSFWMKEIEACKLRQKKELCERNSYPLMISYYEGKLCRTDGDLRVAQKERMSIINDYFPAINTIISQILYQNPEPIARPRKPSAEEGVKLMEGALKYAMDETGMLDENRIACFDMLTAGYGVVEVVNAMETMPSLMIPQMRDESAEPIQRQNPFTSFFGKAKTDEEAEVNLELEGGKDEPESNDLTIVRRLDPLEWYPDWKANRIKDCRYQIKRMVMSKPEFEAKYPEYKGKVNTCTALQYTDNNSEKQGIEVYQIQIKLRKNEYWNLVISPGYGEDALSYEKRPYITEGFDWKVGSFHKYGRIYPIAVAQVNKYLADQINDYIEFMDEVARRNVPKRIVDKTRCDRVAIEVLKNTRINDVAEVEGSPAGIVDNVPATNISTGHKEMIQAMQQQSQKQWSVSAERMGLSGQAEFATELEIQESGFEMRQSDIQEGLRQLWQEELETVKDIIVQFWDSEKWINVTDKEWYEPQTAGGEVLNPLTEVLTGDYAIKVDIDASLKPNKEKSKKDKIDFANWITGPNVMQAIMALGYDPNVIGEAIKKVCVEFGVPEEDFQKIQQMPMMPQEGMPPEGMPVEGQIPEQGVPGAVV